jgi:hypothetical protein
MLHVVGYLKESRCCLEFERYYGKEPKHCKIHDLLQGLEVVLHICCIVFTKIVILCSMSCGLVYIRLANYLEAGPTSEQYWRMFIEMD